MTTINNEIMKKSGIELIAIERQEQIEKHGRTIECDVENNELEELSEGAWKLLIPGKERLRNRPPEGWDRDHFQKMLHKSYKERLIIAGALIAAEIDRIQANEE